MKSNEQRYVERIGIDKALKQESELQHTQTMLIIAECLTCGEVLYDSGENIGAAPIYLYKGIHCIINKGHTVRILKIAQEIIKG